MSTLFDLIVTFFIIGIASFGGGFAMIPLIQEEVLNRHHWMNAGQLADIISVAGLSPGPFATNVAVAVGLRQMDFIGAVAALFAIVLPSLLIIIIAGKILDRIQQNDLVQYAFYGLRPIIAGMIAYAAFVFAQNAGMLGDPNWFVWSQISIFLGSLIALTFLHKHPFSVLILSGLVGIAVYG